MKDQSKTRSNGEVLMITNRGGLYGTGHYNRVLLLKNHLHRMKIHSQIVLWKNFTGEIDSHEVVLLDSRDDEFPGEIISKKKDGHWYIAMDNRGEGRRQCDIVWDTLPHVEMSESELIAVMRNCILDPAIIRTKRPSRSRIIRTTLDHIENGKHEIDLVQYAETNRRNLNEKEFREKLMQSDSIATYFGQTFFEALCLGKEVYLYDISDYHRQLSDWFTAHWNQKPELDLIFEGQGLHRLAALIRSILSGVIEKKIS